MNETTRPAWRKSRRQSKSQAQEKRPSPHAPLGELLQRVEDVPGGPAQPVQLRHHEHVAGLGVKEEPAALGPVPKVRAPAGSAQRLVEDGRLGQLHGRAMLADHFRLDFGRCLLLPRAGAGNAVDGHAFRHLLMGGGGLLFSEGESTIAVAPFDLAFRGTPRRKRSRGVLRSGKGSTVMSHRHAMVLVVLASVLTLAASVAAGRRVQHAHRADEPAVRHRGRSGQCAGPRTARHAATARSAYVYQMGKYDVTVGQYVQFLNAVAKTDTYGLVQQRHGHGRLSDRRHQPERQFGQLQLLGLVQRAAGAPTRQLPSLYLRMAAANNCPIFDVTWGDAARFCNWLQNGQPTGGEGPGTTETGAYTLNGDYQSTC